MTTWCLTLSPLAEAVAIIRLPADAAIPQWIGDGAFLSITRTAEELSLVCADSAVPAGMQANRGWRCLKVHGPFDLQNAVGVLAALTAPLASAGLSLFVISTFDTDYLLIQETQLAAATAALTAAGHRVL